MLLHDLLDLNRQKRKKVVICLHVFEIKSIPCPWLDCEQTDTLASSCLANLWTLCLDLGHLPLEIASKFLEAAAYTKQNMINSEGIHNASTCQLEDRECRRKLHFSKCKWPPDTTQIECLPRRRHGPRFFMRLTFCRSSSILATRSSFVALIWIFAVQSCCWVSASDEKSIRTTDKKVCQRTCLIFCSIPSYCSSKVPSDELPACR